MYYSFQGTINVSWHTCAVHLNTLQINNDIFRASKTQFSIFDIIYRSACTSYNFVRSSHLSTLSNSDRHYYNNQPTKCTQIVCSFYYSRLLIAMHGINNINFRLTRIVMNSLTHLGIYTTIIRILQRDYVGNDSNCSPYYTQFLSMLCAT